MPQQPDHLDVAMGLRLQPAAGAHSVQVAVNVELQQIARRIAGAAGVFGFDIDKAQHCEIEPVYKGVDETHRAIGADIVVNRFGQ